MVKIVNSKLYVFTTILNLGKTFRDLKIDQIQFTIVLPVHIQHSSVFKYDLLSFEKMSVGQ